MTANAAGNGRADAAVFVLSGADGLRQATQGVIWIVAAGSVARFATGYRAVTPG